MSFEDCADSHEKGHFSGLSFSLVRHEQLCLTIVLTTHCLSAPLFKEKRFSLRLGKRFKSYQASFPYMLPNVIGTGGSTFSIDKDLK